MTKPWLNNDIIKLIRFKHYLYTEYKNSYIPFSHYNAFKKSFSGAIVAIKQNFIGKKIQCSSGNSKKTWENINKILFALKQCKIL